MIASVAPRTHLAFWIDGPVSARNKAELERRLRSLTQDGWSAAVPRLVHAEDTTPAAVGCAIELHDPIAGPVSPEVNRAEYDASFQLATAVAAFSREYQVDFEVEY
jgi:hypothetical protein